MSSAGGFVNNCVNNLFHWSFWHLNSRSRRGKRVWWFCPDTKPRTMWKPKRCVSVLANSRSQFLLDRLGRCLKLFVSTETISCHEFASQFGLANLYTRKTHKVSRIPSRPHECLFIIIIMAGMAIAGYLIEERRRWPVITASPQGQCSIWMKQWSAIVRRSRSVDRQRQRTWAATTAIIAASDWAKMGKCKTATTRDYTFTAWKMWFRNYYVAYAFV